MSPSSICLLAAGATLITSSAYAGVSITSSYREVSASYSRYYVFPDTTEADQDLRTSNAIDLWNEAAGVQFPESSSDDAFATLNSFVSPTLISGVASADSIGDWYDMGDEYNTESLAEMHVTFTITSNTPFSLNLFYSGNDYSDGGNSFRFLLESTTETLVSLTNAGLVEGDDTRTFDLAGTLAPGDYTLHANAFPEEFFFHNGYWHSYPTTFDFTLNMIPAPSALAILVLPAGTLGARRRR